MIGQLSIRRQVHKSVFPLFLVATSLMLTGCEDQCTAPASTPSTVSVQDNGNGTCATLADLACTCPGSTDSGTCLPHYNNNTQALLPAGTTITPSQSAPCPSQISCTDIGVTCQTS
jgi:hypothetical protein